MMKRRRVADDDDDDGWMRGRLIIGNALGIFLGHRPLLDDDPRVRDYLQTRRHQRSDAGTRKDDVRRRM